VQPAAPATSFASTLWTAATFAGGGVRGFNQPTDVSTSSMSDMAATGANLVRFFVHEDLSADGNSYVGDPNDLAGLTSVVQSAKQFGFKVIILLQPLSAQNVPELPEFWANTNLQSSLVNIWTAIAQQYVGNTTIAAYDLINEPIAPNGQQQWITLATQMITAIRKIDADHVIIFEPSPGGIPESFLTMKEPLPYSNIVYSVHSYEPYSISSQGISSSSVESYPSLASSSIGLVNSATLVAQLAPVRAFATTFHVSIYVGEFSCVRYAPGTSAYQYMSDSIKAFESAGFSWTYHQWRGYQPWDAEIPESYFQAMPFVNAMPQGWASANTALIRSSDTDAMTTLKLYFESNIH